MHAGRGSFCAEQPVLGVWSCRPLLLQPVAHLKEHSALQPDVGRAVLFSQIMGGLCSAARLQDGIKGAGLRACSPARKRSQEGT